MIHIAQCLTHNKCSVTRGFFLLLIMCLVNNVMDVTFLRLRWLRIHLPVQRIWIQSRVGEVRLLHVERRLSPWATSRDSVQLLSPGAATKELPRWYRGKEFTCQCSRCRFDPWVRKIPWKRKWQPTPVFLPGSSHGQRTWQTIQSTGLQRVGCDWAHTHAAAKTQQSQINENK